MAVRERGGVLVAGAVLTLLLGSGCASSTEEIREPLPPRAVAPETPPPPPSEPPVAIAPKTATVVVLDEGGDAAAAPTSLAEAAARERERRRTAEKPVAVINDKNLAEFARDQKLTVAEGVPEAQEAAPGAATEPEERGEQWWRERGLEIRRRWRYAVDSVERLEGEVAELRNRFYATDDPYLRDSQVKPEWDRKLAELDKVRREAAEGRSEVERFLEEGRVAGALPGWLREGVELEPEPVLPQVEGAEPGEPVVLGEDPPP